MVLDATTENVEVTFVTIATGRYLEFWKAQVLSAKKFLDNQTPLEFVILTDQVELVEIFKSEFTTNTNWNVVAKYVEHQIWPFPTLYKFRHILRYQNFLSGKFVWHLDADMLFANVNVLKELNQYLASRKMILVRHPGYFRPNGIKKYRSTFPGQILFSETLKMLLTEKGLGSWENDEHSLAYVEKSLRKQYVCGGSWGGTREVILNFSRTISERIDKDYDSGVIARFHDESHINWYAANYDCELLIPSYCFEETYKNLKGIPKEIIAVNKNESSAWER